MSTSADDMKIHLSGIQDYRRMVGHCSLTGVSLLSTNADHPRSTADLIPISFQQDDALACVFASKDIQQVRRTRPRGTHDGERQSSAQGHNCMHAGQSQITHMGGQLAWDQWKQAWLFCQGKINAWILMMRDTMTLYPCVKLVASNSLLWHRRAQYDGNLASAGSKLEWYNRTLRDLAQ